MDSKPSASGSHRQLVERPALTRRGFLQQAAAGAVAGSLATNSGGPAPAVADSDGAPPARDERHVVIDHAEQGDCGRAQYGGIRFFGNGELVLLYCRAPRRRAMQSGASADRPAADLERAEVVLRRSFDGGRTWRPQEETIVWSDAWPLEKRAELLCQDPGKREVLDMNRPEAMFFFGEASLRLARTVTNTRSGYTCQWRVLEASRPSQRPGGTVFQVRSVDKGRTWEGVPLLLEPPRRDGSVRKDNHPLVTMPDGALVGALRSDDAVWLYGSECQGMTWQVLSHIATSTPEAGRPASAGLVWLQGGRLQCYLWMVAGDSGVLCLSESDDGFRWSRPRPLLEGLRHPWPLRLRDGRIVVVYARQVGQPGIAAVVSEDEGRTWSAELAVRGDMAAGADVGDPVAVELAAGTIFTAYPFPAPDGERADGGLLLAGSIITLS